MGGNGSYNKSLGGVPTAKRTHTDTGYRIDGHKVLLQTSNNAQTKTPMNSNSEAPIYLIGRKDKKTGKISITTIAIYDKHKLHKSIDIKYDKEGNVIPFKKDKDSSHQHNWNGNTKGEIGRKKHNKSNIKPIDDSFFI